MQCRWPLLQQWQKEQEGDACSRMQLPNVHVRLGPNLPWTKPGDSSTSSAAPELMLPEVQLLQQQAFLQQLTSLTVTYSHRSATDSSSHSSDRGIIISNCM